MKNIYCFVGPSGSGKTTLANRLSELYGYSVVKSYTTRLPRYEGEDGYTFVTPEEFAALGEVHARAHYAGHDYGVTAELLDKNDLYVIEPSGVEFMRNEYAGGKGVVIIGLCVDPKTVEERMRLRGDSDEKIQERLENDAVAFESLYLMADKLVSTEDPVDDIAEYVHGWISCVENDVKKHEFAVYDDKGRVVEDEKEFYSMEDALWALKLAKEMYPNGLPDGWEIRDETLALKDRYTEIIRKLHPSFNKTGIEVDIDRADFSRDGYTYVPFTYNGAPYEYRAYHGEEWIDKAKTNLDARIQSAVKTAEKQRLPAREGAMKNREERTR